MNGKGYIDSNRAKLGAADIAGPTRVQAVSERNVNAYRANKQSPTRVVAWIIEPVGSIIYGSQIALRVCTLVLFIIVIFGCVVDGSNDSAMAAF